MQHGSDSGLRGTGIEGDGQGAGALGEAANGHGGDDYIAAGKQCRGEQVFRLSATTSDQYERGAVVVGGIEFKVTDRDIVIQHHGRTGFGVGNRFAVHSEKGDAIVDRCDGSRNRAGIAAERRLSSVIGDIAGIAGNAAARGFVPGAPGQCGGAVVVGVGREAQFVGCGSGQGAIKQQGATVSTASHVDPGAAIVDAVLPDTVGIVCSDNRDGTDTYPIAIGDGTGGNNAGKRITSSKIGSRVFDTICQRGYHRAHNNWGGVATNVDGGAGHNRFATAIALAAAIAVAKTPVNLYQGRWCIGRVPITDALHDVLNQRLGGRRCATGKADCQGAVVDHPCGKSTSAREQVATACGKTGAGQVEVKAILTIRTAIA